MKNIHFCAFENHGSEHSRDTLKVLHPLNCSLIPVPHRVCHHILSLLCFMFPCSRQSMMPSGDFQLNMRSEHSISCLAAAAFTAHSDGISLHVWSITMEMCPGPYSLRPHIIDTVVAMPLVKDIVKALSMPKQLQELDSVKALSMPKQLQELDICAALGNH
ncbi:hypothetical protein TNCV_3796671 [Trichonephila clavipes]|nr:hypothetical protein TNCV_3796671 [Trichonephila clavipes]